MLFGWHARSLLTVATHGQCEDLPKRVGLGSTTVHRILNEGVIKPHKVDHWCGKSPDPEFEEKQAAIIGLYIAPPENALVLTVDEKSQIQALDRSQPELPLRPGNPKRHTATYKRHGTTCLLAALAVHIGKVDARCVERHTHEEFLSFLKSLYRKNPGKHIHIIADNFSSHKHHKVIEWVSRRRRLTLHFTPTYASWLNQVEIWFNILYTRCYKRWNLAFQRGTCKTDHALHQTIQRAQGAPVQMDLYRKSASRLMSKALKERYTTSGTL